MVRNFKSYLNELNKSGNFNIEVADKLIIVTLSLPLTSTWNAYFTFFWSVA